ncbi:hypothetical protein BJ322DRAFT_1024686 [Thelephora terrestris]|uniref:Protein kinase domain-containing protein n=1 Tax=Thelephora terrestris TaxID=56493 RepID=A0A9P6L2E4_9AGAM|nr:hypothetical protein BJ322DRAFT_1024686 [Thelephora terrestris]
MTTTYIVAYPHPSFGREDRCCRCRVDAETNRRDILDQLGQEYVRPEYIEDLREATLWKASNLSASDLSQADVCDGSTQKIYEWINRAVEDAQIPRRNAIVELFPQGPHVKSLKMVDIVVVTPDITEALGRYLGKFNYVTGRVFPTLYSWIPRNATCSGIQRGLSPSDSVKSSAAVKETSNDPDGPRYGRPSHRFGPPIALFSPPLALLKHQLDHLELLTPDPRTLDNAFKFVTQSADFYENENDRERALNPILKNLLPDDTRWQTLTGGKVKQGGVRAASFIYLIFELKNEQGLGGDPFLQGLVSYGKIVTQDKYARYRKFSNLPAIILAIAGNRLVVSAAIFTDKVYAEELLSVTLRLGPHGSANVLRVGRVFMAINQAMERLDGLYVKLQFASHSPPPPQTVALWPRPTVHPSETQSIPNLEFFAKVDRATGRPLLEIDEDNEHHAMYLARMQVKTSTQAKGSTHEVFVKFSPNYNEAAHRLLAGQKPPLAPALHFCARVIGDMYMVVMEYIPESRGRSADVPVHGPSFPPNLLRVVEQEVLKALRLLHEQQWVFGDLREPNLLYLPESGGRILLVDFDNVGRDGEATYSACLNPEAGFAPGVERGQVMKKEHDFGNLQMTLKRIRFALARA